MVTVRAIYYFNKPKTISNGGYIYSTINGYSEGYIPFCKPSSEAVGAIYYLTEMRFKI